MRAKSHTRELEPEAVLTYSLNPFPLDYSVHFSHLFFSSHFITQYFYLSSELRKEKVKTKINSDVNSAVFFHQFSAS